jgi:deoxyribonuclease-2
MPLVLAGLLLLSVEATAQPSCLNEKGDDVDFFHAFKYPGGWDHAYMDSDLPGTLVKSSNSLNTASSAVSRTLVQTFSSDVNYVFWNDQPPGGHDSQAPNAHAKGAIAFTDKGGFWLTHSLPGFPSSNADSAEALWADGADKYGQSFLCINVDVDTIRNQLSNVMRINRPTVYDTRFDDDAQAAYPEIKAWAVDKEWDKETMTIRQDVKSIGGQAFKVYGKAGKWGVGKDLYRDLVAPDIGSLYMEGWRMGRGVWGPACGEVVVLDVLDVIFPDEKWKVTNDHSKWAVSTVHGSAFCVGDINRADGQDRRGGGTVCITNKKIAVRMRNVVASSDECDRNSTLMV